MKLYVFAIGGSGARILRSLTMLLASGVELPKGTELVPIIIDPDQGAGNLTETVELMKLYRSVRGGALDAQPLTTFSSEMEPLPGEGFVIPLDRVAGAKFGEYIEVNAGLSDASKALIETLFSPEQLDLGMEVGFKGNPNMGSIVLGQFEQSRVYRDFIHSFNGAGGDNRIFIISSIFGGTGASGFPTLLKSLRSEKGAVGQAHIGALSLQPYFALKNNPNSAIDCTTFYAKTRAALSYYLDNIVNNNNIDDLYILGDTAPDTLENNEGGQEQRNDAHFVELAGALSIVDFAHKPTLDGGQRTARVYEFGIQDGAGSIVFKDLGRTEEQLARPLTAFYLMRRYLEQFDVRHSRDAWLTKIQPHLDAAWIDDLEKFLGLYEGWLRELSESQGRSFAPIKLNQPDGDLFDCVEGYPVEIGFLDKWKKQNFDLYTDRLNSDSKGNQPQSEGEMLNLLSNVSYDLAEEKIKLP